MEFKYNELTEDQKLEWIRWQIEVMASPFGRYIKSLLLKKIEDTSRE